MLPIIEAYEVRFKYSSKWVLDSFNLKVNKGEIVGIIGPNGSGKTTIIKLISKVLRPNSGLIKLKGKDISQLRQREVAKIVAVVPQGFNVTFPFTVREIVLMGRSPYLKALQMERDIDNKIVDNAMALTDTLSISDRVIDELSGGERQRVIIARALAQETEAILLDEPTSYLDINHQIEILDLIKRLNREKGITVVIVSHDLNMASEYCDRLVLIKEGKVYRDGSPKEVITEENIQEVYGANIVVTSNILTGTPHIIPVSNLTSREYRKRQIKVHVICGGGTGSNLLRWLAIEGFPVSVGVLNISDSDYKTARSLEMDVVTEAPFSPISNDAHLMNIHKCREADVVILTRVPIGWGNLKNMLSALYALESGVPVIVFDDFSKLDYTGGEAGQIYDQLLNKGAIVAKSDIDVFEKIISLESKS